MYLDMASVLIVVRYYNAWAFHSFCLKRLIPSSSERSQIVIKIQQTQYEHRCQDRVFLLKRQIQYFDRKPFLLN